MIHERKSASYQNTMKNDIKDGYDMKFILKVLVWVNCALLYCCETALVFFRPENPARQLRERYPDSAPADAGSDAFRICRNDCRADHWAACD